MLVRNRAAAGVALAEALAEVPLTDPVVLGLPRGGVPVAYEIARRLGAPLDVLVVRKLGVPGHRELAMGAVGEDGVCVLDEQVLAHQQVSERQLADVVERERTAVARQAATLRGQRLPPPVVGRSVVLVDDGIATGSTMLAACQVVRALRPAFVVVAAPVAPASTLARLRREADEVVCLHTPHPFMAVGLWYSDFTQVSDDEVVALLRLHGGGL